MLLSLLPLLSPELLLGLLMLRSMLLLLLSRLVLLLLKLLLLKLLLLQLLCLLPVSPGEQSLTSGYSPREEQRHGVIRPLRESLAKSDPPISPV